MYISEIYVQSETVPTFDIETHFPEDAKYRHISKPKKCTLVMIIGRSATMADWDPNLLNIFARKRKVTVFDNRWVGTTTTNSTDGATIARFGNDIVGLMDV